MSSDLFYKQLHTPGERLKALRNSLNMSRKEFAEKYGLSEYTLKSLELSIRQLTPIQIQKFIQSFAAEGFECSEEWIMKGEGSVIVKDKKNLSSSLPENHILLEIELFQKHVPHSVVLQIDDESMSPIYKKQDYVGGVKLPSTLKPSDYGKSYIIVFPDETKLVRLLYPGSQKKLFNLVSSNLTEPSSHSLYKDVPLKAIYEILWHRRKST